jgi:uncharacterized protein (TIGR02246 family)
MKKLLAGAVVLTAGALCLLAPGVLRSSGQAKDAAKQVGDKGETAKSLDEKSLLEAIVLYKETFNRNDADALAKLYTEEAELVEPNGVAVKGREAIRKDFASIFKTFPGVQLDLSVESLRWLSGDAVVEHGTAKMTPKTAAPMYSSYSTIHVKQNGKWLITMVREAPTAQEPTTPEERLAPLSWLIGEWQDTDENGSVHLHCGWTKNRSFLMRTFIVSGPGNESVIHGTEIIGWDPVREGPKSFIFDSRGCMAEGHWLFKGDRWYCKVASVLPDGKKVSATHVLRPIDGDHYGFQSVNRTLDGHVQPDTAEVTVHRVIPTEKK